MYHKLFSRVNLGPGHTRTRRGLSLAAERRHFHPLMWLGNAMVFPARSLSSSFPRAPYRHSRPSLPSLPRRREPTGWGAHYAALPILGPACAGMTNCDRVRFLPAPYHRHSRALLTVTPALPYRHSRSSLSSLPRRREPMGWGAHYAALPILGPRLRGDDELGQGVLSPRGVAVGALYFRAGDDVGNEETPGKVSRWRPWLRSAYRSRGR